MLLLVSLPGLLLDSSNAQRIQVSILSFIARLGIHEQEPDYWEVVVPQLDLSFWHCFESLLAEGARMNRCLKNQVEVLSLSAGREVTSALVQAWRRP